MAETWEGKLEVGEGRLSIVVHIRLGADGVPKASLDSPDQGMVGLPVEEVHLEVTRLRLVMRRLGASFEGHFDETRATIAGTWFQGGAKYPLTLRAVWGSAGPQSRPQEPRPPYPYENREVTIENARAGVTLAGTLTLPRGAGPWPSVVLLSGSGAQDRNETVFGHRPFLVLADHLARHGIAVLRLDDRGVGGSTGPLDATVEDLVEDAVIAVAFLSAQAGMDMRRIGLLGHSEGGVIAVRAAARSQTVSRVVLIATPAMSGEALLHLQNDRLLRASGGDDAAVEAARQVNTRLFRTVREVQNAESAAAKLRAILEEAGLGKAAIDTQVKALLSRWFRSFLVHDPRPDLARVKVPMLAIWGERDMQVPAVENLAALRASLSPLGARSVETLLLPRLNHLMQTSQTGAPTEYANIEETMAPEVLDEVTEWLLEHERKK